MKTIFKLFIVLFIPLLFIGCSDDDIDPIIEASDLRLADPGITNVNLNMNTPEANAFLLSWDDYSSYSGDYTVQMSSDRAFEEVIDLGTTANNNFAVSMEALNAYANQLNFTPYLATPVYLRVTNGTLTSNEVSFTVKSYPQSGPMIITPEGGASVTLNSETPDSEALLVSWDDFAYAGTDGSVNYVVQMALAGTNFENSVVLTSTSNTSVSISHADLNNLALAAGILENTTGNVDIRILSTVNAATGETLEFMSAPVTIAISTHESGVKFFYMVGNGVAAGWDPDNNNQPLFKNSNGEEWFTFTGYFNNANAGDSNEGRFKLVEGTEWSPQWGDARNEGEDTPASSGNVAGNPITQANDPGRFGVTASGYYTFSVNFENLTYTMVPYDASGATSWTTIGIIGDATANGWDSDQSMTQSSFDSHQWYLNGVVLGSGQMKFRANDGWDNSWGDDSELYGQGFNDNDPNIPVTAGTYDIWFNDLTGRYVMIPQ